MNRLPALLLFLLAAFAAPSAHAEGPVLVELFASKNCRSCPAAYRNLTALDAERENILILTWPVDYWDYLGGKEKMALPESNERQRGYVERFSLRGPYTPQTVYNGVEQAPGNRQSRIETALARAEELAPSGVQFERKNKKVVSLTGNPGGLTDIWLITYLTGEDNSTDMPNCVTSARQIGPWLGGLADIRLPECASGCALIVQEAGLGRVLAVMELR